MEKNPLFDLAAEIIGSTGRHLFLTGKAGTGKTTFLKHIVQHTYKNYAVIAPTGVAAINAGGVTMHSFLQLPFIPFVPEASFQQGSIDYVDPYSLLKGIQFRKEKLEIFQELELLIIDEVSMLRSDLLDAIDTILRHVRNRRDDAFGGIQMLFIGDLYQLPPVVSEEEWKLLQRYYDSPFFFDAKVMKQSPPVCIELKTIYRQKDEQFIRLLNAVRNNETDESDRMLLDSRLISDPADLPQGGITLSTHNAMADSINQRELENLRGTSMTYTGFIQGVFNDKALPADMQLVLKPGAQVMFVRNDSSFEKRFYNGMLATILTLDSEEIVVEVQETKKNLVIGREVWKNIQYSLNAESRKIEEEELGSFTQFPLRLAWAVTIHKSQGLTFDQVCIDAARSFAGGQVYVALSRCRTLDGLYLVSRIPPHAIRTDQRIVDFNAFESSESVIRSIIERERPEFEAQVLIRAFDFTKLIYFIEQEFESASRRKNLDEYAVPDMLKTVANQAKSMQDISRTFSVQLRKAFSQAEIDYDWLNKKVSAAKKYFSDRMRTELMEPLSDVCDRMLGKSKARKMREQLMVLYGLMEKQNERIIQAVYFEMNFGADTLSAILPSEKPKPQATIIKKVQKGETYLETLSLYKEGNSLEEIALKRGLSLGTIETHIARLIEQGDVPISAFCSENEIREIKAHIDLGIQSASELKERLGENISYGKIRMVQAYLKKSPTSH